MATTRPSNPIRSPSSSSILRSADVERDRPSTEAPVDVEVVEALAAQRRLLGLPVAGEQLLRQRRPVVREVGLGADHHDSAVEAQPAQLLRRPQARERRADDGDRLRGHGARRHRFPDVPSLPSAADAETGAGERPAWNRPGAIQPGASATSKAGDSPETLTAVSSSRAVARPRRRHADRPVSGSHAHGDAHVRPVPVDVSGRPLALRDVDLDVFLHPKSVAVIGASETPPPPEHRDDAPDQGVRRPERRGTFYPVHPTHETVLGVRCYPTIGDIPGDIDLAVILTGKAVDTFEEVLAKKAKFAVIFAAGFSETGKEGERARGAPGGSRPQRRDAPARSRTRTSTCSRSSRTCPDRRSRSSPRAATRAARSSRARSSGSRSTHWAPTGNEVDLEFADFARYFADQPEVGVIACYIEGFKDGRSLMLAADHAAKLRKPIVMVKVGRTDEGTVDGQGPHRATSPAPTPSSSAVFRQFGVTRVDGLDELLETSMAFARTKPPAAASTRCGTRATGVCVYAISGGTGAHMADMVAAAGLRLPPLTEGDAAASCTTG